MDEFDHLPKEWASALITAAGAVFVAAVTVASKWADASRNRKIAKEKEERERVHTLETAQTADLTARLKFVMDGYEAQIKILSTELVTAKDELREERKQNASRNTPRRS